jgi:hypothetical protein
VGSSAGVVATRHRPEVREGEDHADAAQRPVRQVATAPSWQGPFAKRRAVIPAAEYYEWLPTEDADGNPWVTINEAAETGAFQWCAVIEPHTSSRGVTRHRSALRPRRTTPRRASYQVLNSCAASAGNLTSANPTSNVDFGFGPSRATFASKRLNHTS